MKLKNKIRNTLVGLAIIGALALPQGIDRVVNGPYKVTKIGEGFSIKVIHEYNDKIKVSGWAHPWGMHLVDEGKDGSLEEIWYSALPRTPFTTNIKPDSKIFQNIQAEYIKLKEEYDKQ